MYMHFDVSLIFVFFGLRYHDAFDDYHKLYFELLFVFSSCIIILTTCIASHFHFYHSACDALYACHFLFHCTGLPLNYWVLLIFQNKVLFQSVFVFMNLFRSIKYCFSIVDADGLVL